MLGFFSESLENYLSNYVFQSNIYPSLIYLTHLPTPLTHTYPPTPLTGHYISDVYSFPDHSWRTYNDSQVSEVKEEDIRQRRQTTGYIFFYLHRYSKSAVVANFEHL